MRWAEVLGPHGEQWLVEVPETRRERARGLLGRAPPAPGGGMLLRRARSVHTLGMRFPIVAVLLDASMRVVEVNRLPPGRILLPRRGVLHVLELEDGGADPPVTAGTRLTVRGWPRGRGPPYRPRWRAIRRRWISDVPE